MAADIRHSSPFPPHPPLPFSPSPPDPSPPSLLPHEELTYPQEFDYFSSDDGNFLFGEDEIKEPDFRAANVHSDVEDRLELNVDRQTVVGPGLLDLGQALGLALLVGAVLILVLPQQQLQSHPRCGITTGGKVWTSNDSIVIVACFYGRQQEHLW